MLLMDGYEMEIMKPIRVQLQITWYEADIQADAILSLKRLIGCNIDVRCRNHGLMVKGLGNQVWVKGIMERVQPGGKA